MDLPADDKNTSIQGNSLRRPEVSNRSYFTDLTNDFKDSSNGPFVLGDGGKKSY